MMGLYYLTFRLRGGEVTTSPTLPFVMVVVTVLIQAVVVFHCQWYHNNTLQVVMQSFLFPGIEQHNLKMEKFINSLQNFASKIRFIIN